MGFSEIKFSETKNLYFNLWRLTEFYCPLWYFSGTDKPNLSSHQTRESPRQRSVLAKHVTFEMNGTKGADLGKCQPK